MSAMHSHLPVADLRSGVEDAAAREIPLRVLWRTTALPYKIEGERLKIAVADPSNVQAIDELQLATRYRLDVEVAPRAEIELALRRLERSEIDPLPRDSLAARARRSLRHLPHGPGHEVADRRRPRGRRGRLRRQALPSR